MRLYKCFYVSRPICTFLSPTLVSPLFKIKTLLFNLRRTVDRERYRSSYVDRCLFSPFFPLDFFGAPGSNRKVRYVYSRLTSPSSLSQGTPWRYCRGPSLPPSLCWRQSDWCFHQDKDESGISSRHQTPQVERDGRRYVLFPLPPRSGSRRLTGALREDQTVTTVSFTLRYSLGRG